MDDLVFRRLGRDDFPRLVRWQAEPHVARWWGEPPDLATIEARYAPCVDGSSPTEVFVVEQAGRPIGLIQRYLVCDYPRWARTTGFPDDAGIDYYLGEPDVVGRGVGAAMLDAFSASVLLRYPDAAGVVVGVQQANVSSWRALEKAGYVRVRAGYLDSDDPTDAGPAFVYRRTRPAIAPT